MTRKLAGTAGVAVLGGALAMLIALVATPGPWLAGYVSETGTAGQPFATAYRCGLIVLAIGVGLLGLALLPLSRRSGVLLAVAAVLAGTSGAVPCSNRCPLPPYEPTTVIDVVHTAASIIGMIVLAAAMLSIVFTDFRQSVRRLTLAALSVTVPVGLALALIMLFIGRGQLGATVERILLVVVVGWLVAVAGLASVRNSVILGPWTSPPAPAWRSGSPTSRSRSPR